MFHKLMSWLSGLFGGSGSGSGATPRATDPPHRS